jgi:membrane protein YqaA with SNARE-associated domain
MWVANLLGGTITLFLGLIIRIFKASGLIAGYNTASKEEKSKYNEEKLTKYVGNMLIVSSIILLIGGFLSVFAIIPNYLVSISWVLYSIVIIGGVVYMNAGDRIKK